MAVFWLTTLSTMTLLMLGLSATPVSAQHRSTTEAVTAAQAIACINTAMQARAGQIKKREIELEKDQLVCEVEILAADGKKYDMYVEVAGGKIIRNVEDR